MPTNSLARSKHLLESFGYHVWKTEVWNQWSGHRIDLFGLFDLIAIREDMVGVTGIQACGEDCQGHIRKILEGYTDAKGKEWEPNPYLKTWLRAGNRAFIWAWRLRKHEGTKNTWQLREVEFLLENGTVINRENLESLELRR